MTHQKERLLKALNHQEGPIPVDFGASPTTGIHVSVVAGLRAHYGLSADPVKVIEPFQMLGEVDSELRTAMGVDVTGVSGRLTFFGLPMDNWQEWRTPWGQVVLMPGDFAVDERPDGVYAYPQGDRTAAPSAHMPDSGFFFDSIIRQEPIDEAGLDPADNLEEYGPLSDADLEHYRTAADVAAITGLGVVSTMPGTALGDIAVIPGTGLKKPKGIRDVAEWYMTVAARPEYVRGVFEGQCEIALKNLPRLYEVVGDKIDVAFVCGTDFGTQNSQFCSPKTFAQLWLPYYRKINDWIHEHTPWKTFKHSCGAIDPLIPGLIEAGFDILNPVQCSAAGMEPEALKEKYGDQVVFWGGGVDTQHTLPFGEPADVRAQVLKRCRTFAPGGGFVFNTIHNTQALTPIANVVAMVDALKEFNQGR